MFMDRYRRDHNYTKIPVLLAMKLRRTMYPNIKQVIFICIVFHSRTYVFAALPAVRTEVTCAGGFFDISCGYGEVVALYRANYGRVAGSSHCRPNPQVDPPSCSPDNVMDTLTGFCTFHHNCRFTVGAPYVNSGHCSEDSYPYLTVLYLCIQEDLVHDISEFGSSKLLGEGYAKSPGYPDPYDPQRVYQVRGRSANASDGGLVSVDLQLLDLALCEGTTCEPCQDYLTYAGLKLCVMLPPGEARLSTTSAEFSVTFYSDHSLQYRGFLLYYNVTDLGVPTTNDVGNDNNAASNLERGKWNIAILTALGFSMVKTVCL